MKVILDISRNKANKSAFVPISNMFVVFFFVWDTSSPSHQTNWKSSFYGSWQNPSNWTTIYDFEKPLASHNCRSFLAFSGQKAILKSSLETPPLLRILHVCAAAGAPCSRAVHGWWPSPPHLRVVAVTVVWGCTELRTKLDFSHKGDDHHDGDGAAQQKWSWQTVVRGKW